MAPAHGGALTGTMTTSFEPELPRQHRSGPGVRRPDVIVVGGGIGGLSAAFALTRKGFQVRVLERAAEFTEVGAGLQLAPNCTRILGDYGLLDEARRLGVLPAGMIMKDALDGTVLTSLDLRQLERRYGSQIGRAHV